MDTHDDPDDLELPGGDGPGDGPPDQDQLEPLRDLFDPGGPLGPEPSEPGPEPVEELPDLGPIIDELEPIPTTEPDPIEAAPEPDTRIDPAAPAEAAEPPVTLEVDSPSELGPADLTPSEEPGAVDLSLDGDIEPEDSRNQRSPRWGTSSSRCRPPPRPTTRCRTATPSSLTACWPPPSWPSGRRPPPSCGGRSGPLLQTWPRTSTPWASMPRVEHLDLVGLDELLARGGTVLLSTDGSAGVDQSAVVQVEGIDRSGRPARSPRRGRLDEERRPGSLRTGLGGHRQPGRAGRRSGRRGRTGPRRAAAGRRHPHPLTGAPPSSRPVRDSGPRFGGDPGVRAWVLVIRCAGPTWTTNRRWAT